jgi:hypothetical protein
VDQPEPKTALVDLPSWLWGGDPSSGFWARAELHGRIEDQAADVWRVQTQERYLRRRPRLVTVDHLAGPLQSRSRIDELPGPALTDFDPGGTG